MISSLELTNVGPTPKTQLNFGKRLNILTGDNGLGKSFLLDIIWWGLTRTWPQNINPKLKSGYIAKPINAKEKATISCILVGKTQKSLSYSADYVSRAESWVGKQGRPVNPGLVIYTMADGSFALWDPARNYWNSDDEKKELAQVFSQSEIWDGFENEATSTYFNGLLRDWELWQTAKTEEFEQLKSVLSALSTQDEPLELGELKPFRLGDSRRYPTLNTTYQKNVFFPHLSSGVKRVITLSYFLVYAWKRHCESAEQLGEETTNQITFLIDEMEAHLHPKWQRQIVPALLKVMRSLSKTAEVQLITATHSPLVMASLEPIFQDHQDAWFDFDLRNNSIQVERRIFEKYGTVNAWLESEAFDLNKSRALEYSELIEKAQKLISLDSYPDKVEVEKMRQNLAQSLDPTDPFLLYWAALCRKKGLL